MNETALAKFQQDYPIRRFAKNSPVMLRFLTKLMFLDGDCWLWRGCQDGGGYGCLPALGEFKAHRVAWRLFNGEIPNGMKVLHKCDIPRCVNPDHLFLGTQADNVRDMVSKGRNRCVPQHGEQNPMSKLTADQVIEMRNIRQETGMSARLIAEQFGISTMTAHRAINGQSWRKV